MPIAEPFKALAAGNGFPGSMPEATMRPYVAPTLVPGSNSTINLGTGFERFRTLGGYSNSNSGAPTQAQLNLSLKNAMNIYWNIYSSFSVGGGASISNSPTPSVSSSFGNTLFGQGSPVQYLTPKERLGGYYTFDGGQFSDSEGEEQSTYGVATSSRFRFRLVKMMDRTNASSPVFLGYGLENSTNNISAGASADSFAVNCSIKVGSFFNRNPEYLKPASSFPNIVDSQISDISLDGMPYLSSSEAWYFDGGEGNGSASTSSHSASISLNYGSGSNLQVLSANCSINGSNTFYTYSA